MGGTVAETIRKEDGSVIKMARKTGAYNWMFFTKEFCTKDFDKAINEHVASFTEMKEDFESGEPYEFAMSSVYGGCDEMSPIDYGLVVIDFKNKKIHSMQGYDKPGFHYLSMLSNHIILDTKVEEDFDYLISNNLLNITNSKNEIIGDVNTVLGEDFSLLKLRQKLQKEFNPLLNIVTIFKRNDPPLLDCKFVPKVMSEFEIIKYKESHDDILKFAQTLKNEGFSFNQEELNTWKEYNFNIDEWLSDEDYETLNDEQLDAKEIAEKQTMEIEFNKLKTTKMT